MLLEEPTDTCGVKRCVIVCHGKPFPAFAASAFHRPRACQGCWGEWPPPRSRSTRPWGWVRPRPLMLYSVSAGSAPPHGTAKWAFPVTRNLLGHSSDLQFPSQPREGAKVGNCRHPHLSLKACPVELGWTEQRTFHRVGTRGPSAGPPPAGACLPKCGSHRPAGVAVSARWLRWRKRPASRFPPPGAMLCACSTASPTQPG